MAPGIFNPKVLYDGNAIAFSPRRLEFPGGGTGCMVRNYVDVDHSAFTLSYIYSGMSAYRINHLATPKAEGWSKYASHKRLED